MAALWDFTNDNPEGRFALEEGAEFRWQLHPVDGSNNSITMTGWTVKMQVRKQPDATGTLWEISTANGFITVDTHSTYGTGTVLTLYYPGSGTAALTDWGIAYYDIKTTDTGGNIGRLLEGRIEFSRQVTV